MSKVIKITESELISLIEYHPHMKKYGNRKEEFIKKINTFKDAYENIDEILYFFGYEGFTTENDAKEFLESHIEYYMKYPDPVTLYRVIGVKNKKAIRDKEPGEHYVDDKMLIDDHLLMSIGAFENWADDVKPYIMEVQVPLNQIDVLQTLIQNLSFPNENEINLKNKGRGAKFIKATKYK
mgnify:CR=1 FL=1